MAAPTAKSRLLIRRPIAEVFEAFVEPRQLTRFWLSSASGPLEAGRSVHWEFMVPGSTVETHVDTLQHNERIAISWSDGTRVVWLFEDRGDSTTTVSIENSGFSGAPDEAIEAAIEATQGFTLVLCELKVLLETGKSAQITRDKATLILEKLARSS